MEKQRAIDRMVEHLIALGHRRLAFLGPDPSTEERAEAFVQALIHHDLPVRRDHLVFSPWTTEGAYQVAGEFLAEQARTIDAMVCACDTQAIGVLRAAKDYGLSLPQDLAVTGFDDIPFAPDLEPALTTAHVPARLLVALAARRLIERIRQPGLPRLIQMVPTDLVVRASCGAQIRAARAD